MSNRDFVDEIIEMLLQQSITGVYKDLSISDFVPIVKDIKDKKNPSIYIEDFLPLLSRKIKSKINIDFIGVSAPFIIMKTDASVDEIAQLFNIDKNLVKSFLLTSKTKIILIDTSEIEQKSSTNTHEEKQLNLEIIDFIHEIGVKYINCEKLDEDEVKNRCDDIIKKIKQQINSPETRMEMNVQDYRMYINIYNFIDREQLCQAIGLEPSLFYEVENPFVTNLVCDCPRVVFEEFYDKNEWEDAKGANKWLI